MTKQKEYTATESFAYRHNTHNIIDTYNKIGVVISIGGIGCIALGLATTPVPFTTAPLIITGGVLLGYDMKIILPKVYYKIKLIGRWFYANRNIKLIKRTIKSRVLLWK